MIFCAAIFLIFGRESDTIRQPLYQAETLQGWTTLETFNTQDTREPIFKAAYQSKLTLTLHNFPIRSMNDQIPPQAQLARWIKQLRIKDEKITPITQNGFFGLYLSAPGIRAWSLIAGIPSLNTGHFEKLGDITIKVVGDETLLKQEEVNIENFVHSLEWVSPLPNPDA